MTDALHPAVPLLVAALLAAVTPPALRRLLLPAAGTAALALAWSAPDGAGAVVTLMGQPLSPLRMDALGRAFAIVFALVTALGGVYALDVERRRFHVGAAVAAAAGQAIVFAGDWITFYLAWETLAVASFVLVADGGTARARAAGVRYLLVHAAGGACLLAGVVWHRATGGEAVVSALEPAGPGMLVLLGFLVNAAVPPLHAWLTDAYPESAPAGGVLLSAFATKAAVYALARVFAGTDLLVWAGVVMALWGVVFAFLEDDVRRLLGYHIVSQVGYMVAGVGLGTSLALSGAVAHAFSHILYKGLLFMATGALIHATGRRRLSQLGGLAGAVPATLVFYMVGALSISGAPLLNGFVSKSLVLAAAHGRPTVEWLLTLASVGTFLSVGLKLPVLAFGAAPTAAAVVRRVPAGMLGAMAGASVLCVLFGVAPSLLYALMPAPVDYAPYTAGHVVETLELLAGTAIAFLVLRRTLTRKATATLDLDRVYIAVGGWIRRRVAVAAAQAARAAEVLVETAVSDLPIAPTRASAPVGYAILLTLAAVALLIAARGR
jgi:multicomponent Na+:H+ antiporter subunit D